MGLVRYLNMLFDLKDEITFGKHKGITIKEIIKIDPQYLYWACENIKWFALTIKAQKALPPKRVKIPRGVRIGVVGNSFDRFLASGPIGEYAQLALDSEPLFPEENEEY
jgi:hypothetical protein